MDFVALDVETANPDLASVCQIGLVEFRNGGILKSWDWLVEVLVHLRIFVRYKAVIAPMMGFLEISTPTISMT
jgi:DNA polymerase III epsilon subunit-like protein